MLLYYFFYSLRNQFDLIEYEILVFPHFYSLLPDSVWFLEPSVEWPLMFLFLCFQFYTTFPGFLPLIDWKAVYLYSQGPFSLFCLMNCTFRVFLLFTDIPGVWIVLVPLLWCPHLSLMLAAVLYWESLKYHPIKHNREISHVFFKDFSYYFMCMSVLPPVCVCTTYVRSANRGQKRALDSLGLEFQTVVVLGIESTSSTRATRVLNHWDNFPAYIV